jgi:16S rRNA G966 N2-methylase RsmD
VYRYLKKPPATPFDIIYLAPPQYKEMWKETLKLLDARSQWLSAEGTLVVQIHPVEYEAQELKSFRLNDKRKYGSTLLCFYERIAVQEPLKVTGAEKA